MANKRKRRYEILADRYVAIINDSQAWWWSKLSASFKLATLLAFVDAPMGNRDDTLLHHVMSDPVDR